MKRLTKKYKEDYFVNPDNKEFIKLDIDNDHNSSQIIRNKLGKLEDIEEERKINFVLLDLVLTKGIYARHENPLRGIVHIKPNSISFRYIFEEPALDIRIPILKVCSTGGTILKIIDYGKSWALTKEELL